MNNYLLYSSKKGLNEIKLTSRTLFIYLFLFLPLILYSQNSLVNSSSQENLENTIFIAGNVNIVGEDYINVKISRPSRIHQNSSKRSVEKVKKLVEKRNSTKQKEIENLKRIVKNQNVTKFVFPKENNNTRYSKFYKFSELFILPRDFHQLIAIIKPFKSIDDLFISRAKNLSFFIVKAEVLSIINCDSIRPPPFFYS